MSSSRDSYHGEPHIFLEPNRIHLPKPKSTGGFPPTYYHSGEEAPSLEEKLEETITSIESKELRDENAYYVLDLRISKSHSIVSRILRKLKAKILLELNENEILVTSNLNDLKAAKTSILNMKTIRNNIFSIHHLRLNDIVDPELNISSSEYIHPKILTFNLVPNIGASKALNYLSQIRNYLSTFDIPIHTSWVDPETGDSFLEASVTRKQLFSLIEKSSFIFKVHEKMKIHTIKPMIYEDTAKEVKIADLDEESIKALPKICVIDTGVNDIPQLRGLIVNKIAEPPISSPDDLDNHGTSVASLAIYGDTFYKGLNVITPKARIISHKILENGIHAEFVRALSNAINQNQDCKTFTCSLCFKSTHLGFRLNTQRINKIAQRSNRVVLFSAGNINSNELDTIFSAGLRYPDYLRGAPVFHPSDAPAVFSIGACTRYSSQTSLAPPDAPSPFTRFGTNLRELQDSPKPEFVEHGGNLCYGNKGWYWNGVGVKTFSNRGNIIETIGTSLATPLAALHLARIWNKFSDHIKYAETVKAILLSACKPPSNHPRYAGFGVPNEDELFLSRRGVVRVIFEGILPLTAIVRRTEVIPCDEIKVFVPADIKTIELFLVHSDNYELNLFPKLNTYLKVVTEKPGKKGSVKPSFGRPSSRTHVKHLKYQYKRNIKGDWFFRLIPSGIGIPAREREHVMIRYGGVIKMIAKRPRSGIAESVMRGLRRGGRVQIPLVFSTGESESASVQ